MSRKVALNLMVGNYLSDLKLYLFSVSRVVHVRYHWFRTQARQILNETSFISLPHLCGDRPYFKIMVSVQLQWVHLTNVCPLRCGINDEDIWMHDNKFTSLIVQLTLERKLNYGLQLCCECQFKSEIEPLLNKGKNYFLKNHTIVFVRSITDI